MPGERTRAEFFAAFWRVHDALSAAEAVDVRIEKVQQAGKAAPTIRVVAASSRVAGRLVLVPLPAQMLNIVTDTVQPSRISLGSFKEVEYFVTGSLQELAKTSGGRGRSNVSPALRAPFWGMRRLAEKDQCNMEIKHVPWNVIGNVAVSGLGWSEETLLQYEDRKVPVAVNFGDVAAGDELILYSPADTAKPKAKAKDKRGPEWTGEARAALKRVKR